MSDDEQYPVRRRAGSDHYEPPTSDDADQGEPGGDE